MDKLMNFWVSSPGKIILHGEHSVVYNKPALAATIGLRTYINLHENNGTSIKLNYENLDLVLNISLVDVNNFLEKIQSSNDNLLNTNNEKVTLNAVKTFASSYCNNSDFNESKLMAVHSTFFLLFKIFSEQNIEIRKSFEMNVKSELGIGAGLGSSASFNVSLAATFLLLSGQIELKSDSEITPIIQKKISDWAFESEKIMHITPSGIDNTVCSYGKIIRFQKGHQFKSIVLKNSLHILLVDSKVSRNTAILVEKVSQLKTQLPKVVDCILNGMAEIVNSAIPLYENYTTENVDDISMINCLFQMNNDLLKAIGVSHPRLEEIFTIAVNNKFSSKLTGAGGGGFAIILLPNNYKTNSNFSKLCAELTAKGFQWIETTTGDDGIRFQCL